VEVVSVAAALLAASALLPPLLSQCKPKAVSQSLLVAEPRVEMKDLGRCLNLAEERADSMHSFSTSDCTPGHAAGVLGGAATGAIVKAAKCRHQRSLVSRFVVTAVLREMEPE
jgi:hypothetical protein